MLSPHMVLAATYCNNTWGNPLVTADRVQQSAKSGLRRFVRGKNDPAKMTHAKIDLIERDLGAKRAHAKLRTVEMTVGGLCVWAKLVRYARARASLRQKRTNIRDRGDWPP